MTGNSRRGKAPPQLPADPAFDSTLPLLWNTYRFTGDRCRSLGSSLFRARITLRPAVFITGREASRFFYSGDLFTRVGAMPFLTLRLLQDKGSVQILEDEEHRHRKQLFMSLMAPEALSHFTDIMEQVWIPRIAQWRSRQEMALYEEVESILTEAVLKWSGLPAGDGEVRRRTREFSAMIDGAGSAGWRNLRGQYFRARSERWARRVVSGIRSNSVKVPPGSPSHAIAMHRDLSGALVNRKVAAVELINLLRPTVAAARFVTFAALMMHEHPDEAERLASGDEACLEAFALEVRRLCPFFPLIGGRLRRPAEFEGHRFGKGTWMLLDIYGTNRDPGAWTEPEQFQPERFLGREADAWSLIPQGGGDFYTGHRCPGEWLTMEIVKCAARILATRMVYDVPPQDLSIDLSRTPSIPESRFRMRNVALRK